jgi:uncharacterized SAM-binding protein YcdF (DUF218 family)
MNALVPFAPILALSIGSLGYLLSGQFLERARLTSLFALGLIGVAAYLIVGLVPMSPKTTPIAPIAKAGSALLFFIRSHSLRLQASIVLSY